MAWARLDDGMLDNPKVVAAGPLGFAMHVAGILYCARNLTDGFIPGVRLPGLLAVPLSKAKKLARELVSLNLWHDAPGGFMVHDFLRYNPTREKVLAERERAIQKRGRSADVPRNVQRSPSRPLVLVKEQEGDGHGNGTGVGRQLSHEEAASSFATLRSILPAGGRGQ